MDGCQNKDTTTIVNQEHYSTDATQSYIIDATEKILQMHPVPTSVLFQMDHYLHISKVELNFLTDSIETNRFSNNKIELEEIIKKLKQNVALLEENWKKIEQPVKTETKDINFSIIKEYFTDVKTADSMIDKISVSYEDPDIDFAYGDTIRCIMALLGKPESKEDPNFVNKYLEECGKQLDYVKADMAFCIHSKMPVEKSLAAVQESLFIIMKILGMIKVDK